MPKQNQTAKGKRTLRAPIPFAAEFGLSNVDACIEVAEMTARHYRRDRSAALATIEGGRDILAAARAACKAQPASAPAHLRTYFTFLDRFDPAQYPNRDRYYARCRSEVRRALNIGASAAQPDGWTERQGRGEASAARLRDARGKVIARPGDRLTAADVKPAAKPAAKPASAKPARAAKPAAAAAKPAASARRPSRPAVASAKPAARRPRRAS